MSRLALTVARLCFPAWVGAATLFVINGVQQVTFPGFDSLVRNQLALLRFPAYYAVGFTLVGLGTLSLAAARRGDDPPCGRRRVALLLAVTALVLMVVDFQFVYRPLAEMITPPEVARTANFETYHRASEYINTLHVGLVLLAAGLIGLPSSAGQATMHPTVVTDETAAPRASRDPRRPA